MRTPQEYIQDMADQILTDLTPASVSNNDQLVMDLKRTARSVGLNAESAGFKASALFSAELMDHLAFCLEKETELEDVEIGAYYIRQAALRLRTLVLWGET